MASQIERGSERGGYKYSEPPKKRHFEFSKELDAKINGAAKAQNKPRVAIVQDALEAYLSPTAQSQGHFQSQSQVLEIRSAVREAVGDAIGGGVVVSLDEDQRRLVTVAARASGYIDISQFIYDLSVKAAEIPSAQVREFLGIGETNVEAERKKEDRAA